jgi:hypothetical protein
MKTPQQIRNEVEKEIRTNMEIIEVIQLLKKDNHKNILSAKKEGKMLNWDIDKVETIVNLYLDCVLSMLKLNVEVSNSK